QSQGNERAETLLRHLDDAHIPVEIVARGQNISLNAGTSLDVLWPPGSRSFASTNNAGVVLRLNCHGKSVLFPADIQVATERELIDSHSIRADVLVAPHHGSAESTTAEFIKTVDPQII